MAKHRSEEGLTFEEAASIAAPVMEAQNAEEAPPPDEVDSCQNCAFWRFHREEKIGRCHYGPPTPIGAAASYQNAAFPTIRPEDWCGHHRRKA